MQTSRRSKDDDNVHPKRPGKEVEDAAIRNKHSSSSSSSSSSSIVPGEVFSEKNINISLLVREDVA